MQKRSLFFYLGGVALVYKSKKIIATFLAILTTVFSICSSAVIVSADNAFWDYMIGGVEFLRELTGLTFDFSNSMLDTGFKLGEQLDKALKEGESNGLDYGGAYYNKESNMFYLKKDSDNNVYLNQNFYDVVYNTASSAVHALDGYYYFEPKNPVVTACVPAIKATYRELCKDNPVLMRYLNSSKATEDLEKIVKNAKIVFIPLVAYNGEIASDKFYYIEGYGSSKRYLYLSGDQLRIKEQYSDYNHANLKCYSLKENGSFSPLWSSEYGPNADNCFPYIKASMPYSYGEPFKIFYSEQDLKNFFMAADDTSLKLKLITQSKFQKTYLIIKNCPLLLTIIITISTSQIKLKQKYRTVLIIRLQITSTNLQTVKINPLLQHPHRLQSPALAVILVMALHQLQPRRLLTAVMILETAR